MKNIQNILIGLLSVCVIILFVLQYKNKSKAPATVAKAPSSVKSQLIAYFNMDSLESQYEYAKVLKQELKQKETEAGNDIAKKQNERNLKLRSLQEQVSKIDPRNPNLSNTEIATLNDAQKKAQDIEADFQQFKQDLGNKSSEYVRQRLISLKTTIEDYIKKYNSNNTYAYIFSSEDGINNMYYYKDPAFDITNDIIKGLNEEFKSKKK